MRVELGFGTLQSGAYLMVPAVFSLIFCLWVGKATATRGNKVFATVSCVMLLIYTVMAANYSAEMSIAMLVGIVLAVIALVLTLALRDGRGKKAEVS